MRVGIVVAGLVGAAVGGGAVWGVQAWQAREAARWSFNLCAGEREYVLRNLRDPTVNIDSYLTTSGHGDIFLGHRQNSFYALWQACREHGFIRPKEEQEAFEERTRLQRERTRPQLGGDPQQLLPPSLRTPPAR